jgi:hypothetical protein
LAGFILNRRNANIIPNKIHMMVVVKYHQKKNVITINTNSTIIVNPQANQSNQSVIFIAFTIATVKINVKSKYKIHKYISHHNGHILI